jgi:GcrA cell cycle regulator
LVDLEPADCRWPVGDPGKPEFGFCALERHIGSAYCPTHTARGQSIPIKVDRRKQTRSPETRTGAARVPA